ncbi:hypothetical protein GPB2148_2451 [marine gamma proteobacterium HTCC2148]|nr:hypothetical protein GPB2148_2451 [marine gamma proteobacterium HTCC2148]
MCDYGSDSKWTSVIIHEYIYAPHEIRWTSFYERLISEGVVALVGHFRLKKYSHLFSPSSQISFVRKPLARTASEFLHETRQSSRMTRNFEEYIELPEMRNRQSKLLKGFENGAFIGVTELYPESIHLINARFRLNLRVLKRNQAPKGGAAKFLQDLPQSVVKRYDELNRIDNEIYRTCRANIERNLSELGANK